MTAIDRRLNLTLVLDRDDGTKVHVHSTPVREAVLDTYPLELGRTYSMIVAGGLGYITGPRLAGSLLKQVARQTGNWDTAPDADREARGFVPGLEDGFWNEMRRLTSVIALGEDGGWDAVPLDVAVKRGTLSEREEAEVMGMLTFFTLVSLVPKAREFKEIMNGLPKTMWGAQLTSSDCTEYLSGLKTSTLAETTGAKTPKQSSVPS